MRASAPPSASSVGTARIITAEGWAMATGARFFAHIHSFDVHEDMAISGEW
jgi:hypothetical protein